MRRALSAVILAVFIAGLPSYGWAKTYSRTEPVMETFVQVKVVPEKGKKTGKEVKSAVDEAFSLARDLEKKLSMFDPGSEVNALNLTGKKEVSPELFDVLKKAGKISEDTQGAFDTTIAPILKAKGFYNRLPEKILARIPRQTSGVGWENVVLSSDGKTVTLKGGAWIDLSGIAKGYIVDKMSQLLKSKGFTEHLVNAGGDIYCSEKGGEAWNVGLREPGTSNIVECLMVRNMAVATSGDYENVVLDAETGEDLTHIADPAQKRVLSKKVSSVTVIAPICAEADALATAMMVMGREKALDFSDSRKDISAIVVDEEGIHAHSSSDVGRR